MRKNIGTRKSQKVQKLREGQINTKEKRIEEIGSRIGGRMILIIWGLRSAKRKRKG